MKILMVIERHANAGGATKAAMQESVLLRAHGHEVAHFTLSYNPHLAPCDFQHYYGYPDTQQFIKIKEGLGYKLRRAMYQCEQKNPLREGLIPRRFHQALLDFKPDLVSFHMVSDFLRQPKMWPMPGALGIPTTMMLHDATLVCPSVMLLKGGVKAELERCDGVCAREERPGQSCHTYGCIGNPLKRHVMVQDFGPRLQQLPASIDLFMVPSQALMDLMLSNRVIPPERIRLHYNAADMALLGNPVDVSQVSQPTYFLAVGRMVSHKGFLSLVKAFGQIPEIPLVLVGDGPGRPLIEVYLRENNLQNVRLVGWKAGAELHAFYEGCYAVIIPSLCFDNSPVVVQESFAHGKPVIGTDFGGIQEFIRPDQTGFLYNPTQPDVLLEAVHAMWSNPERVRQMGEAGQTLLHQHFTPDKTHQHLMQHYAEAQEIHHHRHP